MHAAIIGLGLIGGSAARDMLRTGFADRLTGVDANPDHARQARERGLVHSLAPLAPAVGVADLVVLAVPVDALVRLLPAVLDAIRDHAVVVDMGSTKQAVVACVQAHPRRPRFVAAHPMAGTEQSGPAAAQERLFADKVAILCDAAASAPDALAMAEDLFTRALGMRLVRMSAARHDLQAAYVSHLSHAVSYALTLAVLAHERGARDLLDLAGGGFASTARLACSPADMWEPIFRQNRAHVLEAIDAFQSQLDALRTAIVAGDTPRLRELLESANRIRALLRK